MGKARFPVSYGLLQDMLHLPPDTEIVEVVKGNKPWTFTVYVKHPDLPDVEHWPDALPVFKRQEPVILDDWGIEEPDP